MAEIRFEWDEAKNLSNQRKHGISFQQATQVFYDPLFVTVKDRTIDSEERWQAYGVVRGVSLLMVAHTLREEEDTEVFRNVSARRASRKERRRYENQNG